MKQILLLTIVCLFINAVTSRSMVTRKSMLATKDRESGETGATLDWSGVTESYEGVTGVTLGDDHTGTIDWGDWKGFTGTVDWKELEGFTGTVEWGAFGFGGYTKEPENLS